jgi:CheY-like chemotaxis protein
MKILIAEDDTISALVLRRALEKLGHEVWMEPNGARAWELLRGQQFRVVMTDWMMPQLTGVELTRNIREREGRPYVYIILLTVKSSPEDRALAMAAGIDDFLLKPFDPADLVARIEVAERMIALKDQVAQIPSTAPSRVIGPPEIGSILLANGVITARQLESAIAEQIESGMRIGEILCVHGWAGEEDVARAYAEQAGVPYTSIRDQSCSPEALALVSRKIAVQYRLLPVDFASNGKLRIAVENPYDFEAIALVERLSQRPVDIEIAAPNALALAIADAYGQNSPEKSWDLSMAAAA